MLSYAQFQSKGISVGESSVVIAAAGDISFYGEPGEALDVRGAEYPFGAIKHWLDDADLRFANMESVLCPEDFPAEKLSPKALASPERHAAALKSAGFDVLNMASNHVLDCGTIGMLNTQKALNRLGIQTFGVAMNPSEARKPLVIEKNNLTIGFIGYQEDCNYTYGHVGAGPAYLVEENMLEDVAALRQDVDVVVVSVHSDLEFMETPAVWRKQLSHKLADAGADLVLHTHPHVPQGIELRGRSLIAYSLGNCLFDAHTSAYMRDNGPHTGHSFVLKVTVGYGGVEGFERLPFDICKPPGQRPVPMEGEAFDKGIEYLEYLDREVANDETVQKNWRKRCMEMLAIYMKRMEGMKPEDFMERWAWVLAGVTENHSWTSELVRMAEERYQQEGESEKEFIQHHRPSWRYENK